MTVGQGEWRNAVLLRRRLNGAQQVTKVTRRRSSDAERPAPSSPLFTPSTQTHISIPHSCPTLCTYDLKTFITQSEPSEDKYSACEYGKISFISMLG